jgi:hypothetical protein
MKTLYVQKWHINKMSKTKTAATILTRTILSLPDKNISPKMMVELDMRLFHMLDNGCRN